MNLRIRLALVVLILGSFPNCSRKPEVAPPNAPAALQFQSIADIPGELRAAAEKFGHELEANLKKADKKAVVAVFDLPRIVDTIANGIGLEGSALKQFRMGMNQGISTSTSQVAEMWGEQDGKFKGVVLYKGDPAVRFRFNGGDKGISFVDFTIAQGEGGKISVINFYNQVADIDLVEQIRQTAVPVVSSLDKNILSRLLAKQDVKPEDLKSFGELSQKLQRGDFPAVISGYKALPTSLREGRLATTIYISALQRSGDDDAYRLAIKEAAARFNSPNYDFMLVDVHYIEKEYGKAVECLDRFMARVEKDAVLLTLKAGLQSQAGDAAAGRNSLQEALQLEPDCVFVREKGLDVFLAAKDFAATRDAMLFLEEKAGLDFKGRLNDALWEEFKKAPESARWR